MKRFWVVAAIPLAWAGCKPQPALQPPPVACRVNLPKLVASHPRWPELRAMDARINQLGYWLAKPLPPSAKTALPKPLPPIPDPQPSAARAVPAAIDEMAALRDSALRAQRLAVEQRNKARLESERIQREGAGDLEGRLSHTRALDELWQGQAAIIGRYQPDITRLRTLTTRLREPSPIPDQQKRRGEELAKSLKELADLERHREVELKAVAQRIDSALQEEQKRRHAEDATAIEALRAELQSQQETLLRTADQEWQERSEAAAGALQEPPPAPAVPPSHSTALPASVPVVRLAPAAAGTGAPGGVLAGLTRRRDLLRRYLETETRGRVLGIAARHNLRPQFDGKPGLPDRTGFFLGQMRAPEQE